MKNKLARIQERIKSRFSGGLVVDIQKPDPEKGKENNEIIMELAESGKLKPHICKEFPLKNSKDGLEYLRDRKLVGKVTVTMS